MSKYFWKYTTIVEWKPDSLAEDENPDTPVCLILNESEEPQAILTVKVPDSSKASYVFACKDELKEFDSLQEAIEFIGIDTQEKDAARFVNDVRMFVLSEQAKIEKSSIYYTGINSEKEKELEVLNYNSK